MVIFFVRVFLFESQKKKQTIKKKYTCGNKVYKTEKIATISSAKDGSVPKSQKVRF